MQSGVARLTHYVTRRPTHKTTIKMHTAGAELIKSAARTNNLSITGHAVRCKYKMVFPDEGAKRMCASEQSLFLAFI